MEQFKASIETYDSTMLINLLDEQMDLYNDVLERINDNTLGVNLADQHEKHELEQKISIIKSGLADRGYTYFNSSVANVLRLERRVKMLEEKLDSVMSILDSQGIDTYEPHNYEYN